MKGGLIGCVCVYVFIHAYSCVQDSERIRERKPNQNLKSFTLKIPMNVISKYNKIENKCTEG